MKRAHSFSAAAAPALWGGSFGYVVVLNIILWSALLAFSQDTTVKAHDDPENSQAPAQMKCSSKPALSSTARQTQTLPATTEGNRENATLKTSDGARETNGSLGETVRDESLSTTIDRLTKDAPKPAQCTRTTEGAHE